MSAEVNVVKLNAQGNRAGCDEVKVPTFSLQRGNCGVGPMGDCLVGVLALAVDLELLGQLAVAAAIGGALWPIDLGGLTLGLCRGRHVLPD